MRVARKSYKQGHVIVNYANKPKKREMKENETYYKTAQIIKDGIVLKRFEFKWIDILPSCLRFRDIKPHYRQLKREGVDAYYIGNISYEYDLNRRECFARLESQNIDIIINF